MNSTLHIDPANGFLLLEKLVISPETDVAALPAQFSTTRMTSPILGKTVQCVFAHTTQMICGMHTEVNLRFDDGSLVSVFITLIPAKFQNQSDDAFYRSVDDRYNFHLCWLRKQLGKDTQGHNTYSWGAAGVGRNKSEDVFIYLHNKNNTWAASN